MWFIKLQKGRCEISKKKSKSTTANKLREFLLGHIDFLSFFSEQLHVAVCFSKNTIALYADRFHILLFALPVACHNETLIEKRLLFTFLFQKYYFQKVVFTEIEEIKLRINRIMDAVVRCKVHIEKAICMYIFFLFTVYLIERFPHL